MLLLAGAGYVASLPAGDVQQQNQVRAVGYETVHEILAREPKKGKKGAAGAGKFTSNKAITRTRPSLPGLSTNDVRVQ